MLTYRETRVLFVEKGELVFPAPVEVTVAMAPSPVFGDPVKGQTIRLGDGATAYWNANLGGSFVEPKDGFPLPDLHGTVGKMSVALEGHVVRAAWTCQDRKELMGVLAALHFALPVALCLSFQEPFVVATTSGHTDSASFVWQVEQTPMRFEVVDVPDRDQRLVDSLRRFTALCEPENIRLLAASSYFHRAVLLLESGPGPSDFAGEAVVNLAKVLEVLFGGPSRDKVRDGLRATGYEDSVIEAAYVPCLLLRSQLDAAHVGLATLIADERRTLQTFLEGVVQHFRTLLVDLIEKSEAGQFVPVPYEPERKDDDDLARLVRSLQLPSSSAPTQQT
jgi:hypothetical protein